MAGSRCRPCAGIQIGKLCIQKQHTASMWLNAVMFTSPFKEKRVPAKADQVSQALGPREQCLSQDLETGCLKLAVVKFWGIQVFQGDHNILIFQL